MDFASVNGLEAMDFELYILMNMLWNEDGQQQ
jgi:hypothetical protein